MNSGGVPIIDVQGRVVGLNAGIPNDANWPNVVAEANHVMETVGPQLKVEKKYRKHRRGNFTAYPHGIVHGNGRLVSALYIILVHTNLSYRPLAISLKTLSTPHSWLSS